MSFKQKSVAIVILNWNGLHFLKQFLPNVVNHSKIENFIVNTYVADNGSTDGSLSWLKSEFPQVKTIDLGLNHGFAQGYNLALKQIESDYFMVLNSDVLVEKDWLEPLVNFLESNPKAAACQPKILSHSNPNQFEYAGAAGGFIDVLGYPFCRGRIISTFEMDRGQYDEPLKTFWATGACMLVRSKAYWEAGGFDSDFFAHMEEIDLCWRFYRLGYEVWCIPASPVWHVGGGTLPNNNPFKIYLNYRNNLAMLLKNLSSMQMWALWVRMAFDWLSAFAYFLTGKPKFFHAVMSAHLYFVRNYRKNKLKKSAFSQKPDIQPPIYRRSIVFQYFLFRKRFYTEL